MGMKSIRWILSFLVIMSLRISINAEPLIKTEVQGEEVYIDTTEDVLDDIETSFDSDIETEITEVRQQATDLDLGDYQRKMTIGETQLISVTQIPINAIEQDITYFSSNTEVATINGIGRITANAVGETEITITCGDIQKNFILTVSEENPDEEKIAVVDVEIADHADEVEVGETIRLSATILPTDATETQVIYRSSDSNIATVSSTGVVKGISKGSVVIYCSAGYVTKEIVLNVKVATQKLDVNKEYIVMKKGENFALEVTVEPAEAPQTIIYRSSDEKVATVSESGNIVAKAYGSTNILVSNGDSTISVAVIVNGSTDEKNVEEDEAVDEQGNKAYDNVVYSVDVPIVTANVIRFFYEQKDVLTIKGDGYAILIDGEMVTNYQNRIYTELLFEKEEQGISFVLNKGEELCGTIILELDEQYGEYLYLYNESKRKYERIETEDMSRLVLTSAGKYLITEHEISTLKINWRMAAIGGGGLVALLVAYIVAKKRYWFW